MIKVFKLKDFQEANEFMKTVDVREQGGLMFTDENIVISYDTKEDYEKSYLQRIVTGIKRNRFHSEVLLDSKKIELALAEKKFKAEPNTKELEHLVAEKKKALETALENIQVADEQLAIYESKLQELN